MTEETRPGNPLDLEALLARMPCASPREGFRRALRERFLAGAPNGARVDLGSDEELEAVLCASLAVDERAAAGREAARARFLGELASAPANGAPRADGVERRAPRVKPTRRWPALALAGGLATAAVVLVFARFANEAGESPSVQEPVHAWSLRNPREAGAEGARLLAAANAGEPWEHASPIPADLVLGGRFVVRVQPGTRFTAPALARLPADAPMRFQLELGEMLIRTVRGYEGAPIEVVCADAAVRVTGTAVSVMSGGYGTCVCVSHGTVLARQLATGRQDEVGPRETWFSFVEAHPSFGQCYDEAFGHPGGLLGADEAEHLAPLMELEREALFGEPGER